MQTNVVDLRQFALAIGLQADALPVPEIATKTAPTVTTLRMVSGVYRSKEGFRPVVRLSANGKMKGNKSSPHIFQDAESALSFARNASAAVALSIMAQFPDCAVFSR